MAALTVSGAEAPEPTDSHGALLRWLDALAA